MINKLYLQMKRERLDQEQRSPAPLLLLIVFTVGHSLKVNNTIYFETKRINV